MAEILVSAESLKQMSEELMGLSIYVNKIVCLLCDSCQETKLEGIPAVLG